MSYEYGIYAAVAAVLGLCGLVLASYWPMLRRFFKKRNTGRYIRERRNADLRRAQQGVVDELFSALSAHRCAYPELRLGRTKMGPDSVTIEVLWADPERGNPRLFGVNLWLRLPPYGEALIIGSEIEGIRPFTPENKDVVIRDFLEVVDAFLRIVAEKYRPHMQPAHAA